MRTPFRSSSARAIYAGLLATSLLAACGDERGGGSQSVTWEYSLVVPLATPTGELAQAFAEDVKERTDGRFDIQIRAVGELPFKPGELFSRVGDGSVAMADVPAAFGSGECPAAGALTLPLLVQSIDEVRQTFPIVEPMISECTEGLGARLLYYSSWPSSELFGRGDPVTSLEDLQGLSIRQTGPEAGAFLKELGAEPVTLSTEESPVALEQGVIDGMLTSAPTARNYGWYESMDWAYLLHAGAYPSLIVVNQEAYDDLPENFQSALDEAAEQATVDAYDRTSADESQDTAWLGGEGGLEVTVASDEERAQLTEQMISVWDTYGAADPDVKAVIDAIRDELGR